METILSNDQLMNEVFADETPYRPISDSSRLSVSSSIPGYEKLVCKFRDETFSLHFRGSLNFWQLTAKILLHIPTLKDRQYELSYINSEDRKTFLHNRDKDLAEMFFHKSILGEDVFVMLITPKQTEESLNTFDPNQLHEVQCHFLSQKFTISFQGKITVDKLRSAIRRRLPHIIGSHYTMSYYSCDSNKLSVLSNDDALLLFNAVKKAGSSSPVYLYIEVPFEEYDTNSFDSIDSVSYFDRLTQTHNVICQFGEQLFEICIRGNPTILKLKNCIIRRIPSMQGTSFRITYNLTQELVHTVHNDDDVHEFLTYQLTRGIDDLICIIETVSPSFMNFSVQISDDHQFNHTPLSSHSRPTLSRDWGNLIVCQNQKFEGGADDFRLKVLMYAAETGFLISWSRNEKDRIKAICSKNSTELCQWSVYATKDSMSSAFLIRTINNHHSCTGRIRSRCTPMITSKVVAFLIKQKVEESVDFSPISIIAYMSDLYGFDIKYNIAYTAKLFVKEETHGSDEESYAKLEQYIRCLSISNPGSYTAFEVHEGTNRFKRVFFAFAGCIKGFLFCRPVLSVDGTFLKSKYQGTLLTAIGKNGDEGIFPLAFAVVSSENDDDWNWFTQHLSQILRPQNRVITFISDRNHSLLTAIQTTFPDWHNGYCYYHMRSNVEKLFNGTSTKQRAVRAEACKYFKKCMYALTRENFDKYMANWKELGETRVNGFLRYAPFHKWANSYFEGQRYGDMCSNPAESFNSMIRKERCLPITEMIDGIRVKLMSKISERYDQGKRFHSVLCPNAEKRFHDKAVFGSDFHISKSSDSVYEVIHHGSSTVDIGNLSCSCQEWRINSFPCAHAATVIQRLDLEVYKFIDLCFHVESFRSSHSFPIYPVLVDLAGPGPSSTISTLPPYTKRRVGRPKNKREEAQNFVHVRRPVKCGRCGVGGHNKLTCTQPSSSLH